MKRNRIALGACAISAGALLLSTLIVTAPADGSPQATAGQHSKSVQSRTVDVVPSAGTPNVLDGAVKAIAKVGNTVIIAGNFTQLSSAGSGDVLNRSHIAAFDPRTGQVTSFNPTFNGTVTSLSSAGDGTHVFVAGAFTTTNGTPTSHLVKLDIATGAKVGGFNAATSDKVINAIQLANGMLVAGGFFTTVGGAQHHGLASFDPNTGAVTNRIMAQFNGSNAAPDQAQIGVHELDIDAKGDRLVAVGNFAEVNGKDRSQVAMLRLANNKATLLADWATKSFQASCFKKFATFIRDVDFAPNSQYFVIVTSGGAGTAGRLCDSASRWPTYAKSQTVKPLWVADTGRDTLLSVAVADQAVYVGGHQRWMNNPIGRDRPREGAVPRPGIAALNPINGLPLSWNPGRNPRGVGAGALLLTSDGLYVGSDTDYIGNRKYKRGKIALFPLAGPALPDGYLGKLPGTIYQLGTTSPKHAGQVTKIGFTGRARTSATHPHLTGTATWTGVRGAMMIDKTVFYGLSDGTFNKRSFFKHGFGPRTIIDPYHDPAWAHVQTGSHGGTYDGMQPSFYKQISKITGMFYWNGRIYYALSTDTKLHWRYFDADSGVVSTYQHRLSSRVNWTKTTGLFRAGTRVYYASKATGRLASIGFANGKLAGKPTALPKANRHGFKWSSRGLMMYAGPAPGSNEPPTARFVTDCIGTSCTFNAGRSHDPDGRIARYSWSFSGATTARGKVVNHNFGGSGTYFAELTVTDDNGAKTTKSVPLTLASSNSITLRGTDDVDKNARNFRVTVPANTQDGDALIAFLSINRDLNPPDLPAGWNLRSSSTARNLSTYVWTKTADGSDPGSNLDISFGPRTKASFIVAAYGGTAAPGVAGIKASTELKSVTKHPAPRINVGVGSWVISYWANKSPSDAGWTAPGMLTTRVDRDGFGPGRINALLADTAAPVPAELYPTRFARTAGPSELGVAVTISLTPAG